MTNEGPLLECQKAIVAAMIADATLGDYLGDGAAMRLFQDVLDVDDLDLSLAYVVIGDDNQNVPDLAQFLNGSEVFVNVHIFSRAGGFEDVHKIANRIEELFHDNALALTENRCLLIERSMFQTFRDGDGKTARGVVTLRALAEAAT